MTSRQLKRSGHYTTSFFAALRSAFCVRTDYQSDRVSRVRFFEAALFLPFVGLFVGFVLMVLGMIGSFVFQSNVIAGALVVCAFVGLLRGFFNSATARFSWFDASLLIGFLSLAYTAFERHSYLPLLMSVGIGCLTTVFATGLGKDLPMAPRSKQLCGTYRNEDLFFLIFIVITFAVISIVVLKGSWYIGFLLSMLIAASVPHFIAQHDGGVTSQGISRGILLGTVITCALLLVL